MSLTTDERHSDSVTRAQYKVLELSELQYSYLGALQRDAGAAAVEQIRRESGLAEAEAGAAAGAGAAQQRRRQQADDDDEDNVEDGDATAPSAASGDVLARLKQRAGEYAVQYAEAHAQLATLLDDIEREFEDEFPAPTTTAAAADVDGDAEAAAVSTAAPDFAARIAHYEADDARAQVELARARAETEAALRGVRGVLARAERPADGAPAAAGGGGGGDDG